MPSGIQNRRPAEYKSKPKSRDDRGWRQELSPFLDRDDAYQRSYDDAAHQEHYPSKKKWDPFRCSVHQLMISTAHRCQVTLYIASCAAGSLFQRRYGGPASGRRVTAPFPAITHSMPLEYLIAAGRPVFEFRKTSPSNGLPRSSRIRRGCDPDMRPPGGCAAVLLPDHGIVGSAIAILLDFQFYYHSYGNSMQHDIL